MFTTTPYILLSISLYFFTPTCKSSLSGRFRSKETKMLPLISEMLGFLGSLFIIILTLKIF